MALGLQEVVEKQRAAILHAQGQRAPPAGKRRLAAVSALVDSIQALHVCALRSVSTRQPALTR